MLCNVLLLSDYFILTDLLNYFLLSFAALFIYYDVSNEFSSTNTVSQFFFTKLEFTSHTQKKLLAEG